MSCLLMCLLSIFDHRNTNPIRAVIFTWFVHCCVLELRAMPGSYRCPVNIGELYENWASRTIRSALCYWFEHVLGFLWHKWNLHSITAKKEYRLPSCMELFFLFVLFLSYYFIAMSIAGELALQLVSHIQQIRHYRQCS